MRCKTKLRKAMALLLAVAIMTCQPAMTMLAAEIELGEESTDSTSWETSKEGTDEGAEPDETCEQEDAALSQPEEPAEDEAPTSEPEELVEDEAAASEPEEPAEDEAATSEPEEPAEDEAPTSEREEPAEDEAPTPEPEEPTEDEAASLEPEEPASKTIDRLLSEIQKMEPPNIVMKEDTVDEQESVIKTAPLGRSIEVRAFGFAPFSAGVGDGSVAKMVADNHVVMQRADGRLLVWGDNTYGQLGLGSGADKTVYTPTQVPFFKDKDIEDIAVVQDATFVLLTNGELYAFGKGTNGRLGLGSNTNVSTPTLIPGSPGLRINGLYPMKESMIVTTENNTIYAWGRNNKGQLGDGTKVDKNTPTRIMEDANVKSLYVGDDYAILIKQDDTIWAWGNNTCGVFPYDSHYTVTSSTCNTSLTAKKYVHVDTDASLSPGKPYSGQPNSGSSATYNLNLPESLTAISPGSGSYRPNAPTSLSGLSSQTVRTKFTFKHRKRNDDDWETYGPVSHSYSISGSASIQGTISGMNISYYGSGSWSGKDSIYTEDYYNDTWYSPDIISFNATASSTASWALKPTYLDFSNATVVGNITHLMPGSKHWYMIQDGQLYSQGDNSLMQQTEDQTSGGYLSTAQTIRAFINTLESSGDSFGELVVAGDTNYIITSNGDVHAWGSNASGKTGTGLTSTFVDRPTSVYSLNGKSIASIVSGRNSTLFVSHTGDVYAVGDNSHGQLGLGEEYADQKNVTMPEQIETFRFSETELPPDPPEKVEAPDEVDAGTQISIRWGTSSNAVAYELQRTVSLKGEAQPQVQTFNSLLSLSGGAFSVASDSESTGIEVSEVVYNGEETQYNDVAQPNWETVIYSVKALNSIGDYSPEKTTNAIAVKPGSGNVTDPTSDTTPPTLTITTDAASKTIHITAVDTDSGMEGIYINNSKRGVDRASYVISNGETVSIYGKDNAGNTSTTRSVSYTDVVGSSGGGNNDSNNSGSGLTDTQLLAVLAALNKSNGNSGLDRDDILDIVAALRRSNPVVTSSGVDQDLLRWFMENNRTTQTTTPNEVIRYVQAHSGSEAQEGDLPPEILSLLLSQLQGSKNLENSGNNGGYDLMTSYLLVKLLSEDGNTQQSEYSAATQGPSLTVGIFLAVLTVVTVLMAAAFPLTVIYFNRKLKAVAGGQKPENLPEGEGIWKERYNQVAMEYNELVDMVTKSEENQSQDAAQHE